MKSLLERLQYHTQRIDEGEYFWDRNETGGQLEVLYDPTPKELQDFLKDYPICKAVSNGAGQWIFAYGQKICHDTLDVILEKYAQKYNWYLKSPSYMDDHLSVTNTGLILGFREAGSFEPSLCDIFMQDEEGADPLIKKRCYYNLKMILAALKSLKSKYSWFKPSPSLVEELIALKNVKSLKYVQPSRYRW